MWRSVVHPSTDVGLEITLRLVPCIIGVMMTAVGGCYLVSSLALILSPALSNLVPRILLSCLLGQLSLAFWLVVKGVKLEAQEAR